MLERNFASVDHCNDSQSDEDSELDDEDIIVEDGEYIDSKEMKESEERLVNAFMNSDGFQRRTLADMILEKIREKEEAERAGSSAADDSRVLSPKIIEAYHKVGNLLQTYKSGKLPKLFKVIPSCKNWEELLDLTRPDLWSPHSYYAATKIFSSALSPHLAQRFYNFYLLERCRNDLHDNKKLNYHHYQALCLCVYKPAAFFKGIILPLAAAGNCTLKEANIFGSVLAKTSIPANHSAVALLKLAEMPYSGASSVFIQALLNKKYALPKRVISSLVTHFVGFKTESRELPVLWHKSLLTFIQRYKNNIDADEKQRFKELFKAKYHHLITNECRRELFGAAIRHEEQINDARKRQMPNIEEDVIIEL